MEAKRNTAIMVDAWQMATAADDEKHIMRAARDRGVGRDPDGQTFLDWWVEQQLLESETPKV